MRGLGDSVGSTVVETVGRVFGRAQEHRPLPVDLYESDDEFLAVFDAPGALSEDVQVKYEDDAIVVRVDRFREFYEEFEMQFPGRGLTLDGRVELPAGASVDPTDASATLKEHGTLHVRIPKVADDDADETSADLDETDEETDEPRQADVRADEARQDEPDVDEPQHDDTAGDGA